MVRVVYLQILISFTLLASCAEKQDKPEYSPSDQEWNSLSPDQLTTLKVTSRGCFGGSIDSILIDKKNLYLKKFELNFKGGVDTVIEKKLNSEKLEIIKVLLNSKSDTLRQSLCTTSTTYVIVENGVPQTVQDNSCLLWSAYVKLLQ